ncbi:MAG TPA: response regulator [Candidatus Binataceae bacterium]|nr:response regulator [Candidatus Binataceae bacterium]
MNRKRLLFVDDEPAIRETLSLILPRYGFNVTLAATLAEALEKIRQQEFDILLSDLNIESKSDGYRVVRAMQAFNPSCLTVILTGYGDVESGAEGSQLGIDDYISKPVAPNELVALLAEKLAAKSARFHRIADAG